METKTAVIFGVNGQDGSYLSELLLSKGYFVVGVKRRSSTPNDSNIQHLYGQEKYRVIEGDVTDPFSIFSVLSEYDPDEVYNLAAQSHVSVSFAQPALTWEVTAVGCLNILECIRKVCPYTRFYQASTSEMFGDSYSILKHSFDDACNYKETHYQDEDTPFNPRSPYAIAKLAAHNTVLLYRDAYGIHASSGILMNHESSRRGENFVTRKITKYVADGIVNGFTHKLKLGNLDANRDWGHSKDFCMAMWLMLQQDTPDNYVIATGKTNSIRDLLKEAFSYSTEKWEDWIEVDQDLIRPAEVPHLLGKATKAHQKLGWAPTYTFPLLIKEMVESDVKKISFNK